MNHGYIAGSTRVQEYVKKSFAAKYTGTRVITKALWPREQDLELRKNHWLVRKAPLPSNTCQELGYLVCHSLRGLI